MPRNVYDALIHPNLGGVDCQYDVIIADPPFRYARQHGIGSADRHYETMSIDDLSKLPVQQIASDNCALLIWVAGPKLCDALALIQTWGFQYSTVFTNWIKTAKYSEGNHIEDATSMRLGSWTYPSCELLLVGTRGTPVVHTQTRIDQLLIAPRRAHSEKPVELWEVLGRFFPSSARGIELFARVSKNGSEYSHNWDVWGLEAERRIDAVLPTAAPRTCQVCCKSKPRDEFYPGQKSTCCKCYVERQRLTNKRLRG